MVLAFCGCCLSFPFWFYLLLRTIRNIRIPPRLILCFIFMGGRTYILSAIGVMEEEDIKKVVAISTLRQLGFIIISLGLDLPTLVIFHIITHAFFKSLLFICVGQIINLVHGSQELQLSSILLSCSGVSSPFVVSLLSIGGFPFLAGFYSKDLILEFRISHVLGGCVILLLLISSIVSVGYSLRLLYAVCRSVWLQDKLILYPFGR